MKVEHYVTDTLVMNVPKWFADPEFMAAIDNPEGCIATWHRKGEPPSEYSDVMLFVDPSLSGEGSEDGEIPDRYWDQVVEACRQNCGPYGSQPHILVRLTNLQDKYS